MGVESLLISRNELVGDLGRVIDAFTRGERDEIVEIAATVLDCGGRVVMDFHPLEVQLDVVASVVMAWRLS